MDKVLRSNVFWLVIAFVLAVMLWMIVNIDQPHVPGQQHNDEISVENVDVEVIYDEERYALTEVEEDVRMILTGRRSVLFANQLRTDPYRVYADLSGLEAGTHDVPLQHEGFPDELQVEFIPSHIRVVLEEKGLESYNVELVLTGETEAGFEVGQPAVTPDEVFAIAPVSVLERISTIRGYLNIDNADERLNDEVELKAYDREGNVLEVELSPETAEVEVPIHSPSTTVPLRLDLVNSLPDGLSFSRIALNRESVEVAAPLDVLNTLSEIPVTVDLSEIDGSTTKDVTLPRERQWIYLRPQEVEVQVEVGPTVSRTFNDVPIQVRGLDEAYEVIFEDDEQVLSELVLSGSQERVNDLQQEQLDVYIDVTDLSQGAHTVDIAVDLPSYIQGTPAEDQVNITIQSQRSMSTTTEANEEEEGE
ncbi:YbbR-like domain-containing protein [Caldalkalibacillus salinus]|uniref:CdaR family protein n=1 Tax=Caldalkalibacillus salinus TaxID=2803787 RepID=UPI0019214B89|nr:CdaR family protein [Caldalkalibacillus salinus]